MQVKCRSCQQPIPATNVNVQSMIAKCELCHAVFGLSAAELHLGQRMGPPPGAFSGGRMSPSGAHVPPPNFVAPAPGGYGPMSGAFPSYAPVDRGQVPMPQGITVEIDGKNLVIRRAWFHWAAFLLLFFSLIWTSFVLVFIAVAGGIFGAGMGAAGGDAWPIGVIGLVFMVIPLLFLFVGLAMGYFALAMFLNTTTIRVDAAEISVAHGPIPWWGNVTVLKSDVEQLFCVERVHHGKRGAISFTYDVEMVLRGNVRHSLASQLSDVGQALFIEQQVERHLGLEDVPVPGEVRRW